MTNRQRHRTQKFEQLDALRFFSILPVLITHWLAPQGFFLKDVYNGGRGVQMFFVLSGFLITLGLISARDKPQTTTASLYKFYLRRALRIFPLYYLVIILVWLFDHEAIAQSFWWNVFYASNFYTIKTGSWGGSGHLWSLAVEEQFYLVWPCVILFASRRALPFVIGSAILASLAAKVYWQVAHSSWLYGYVHPLSALDSLATGALLSYWYYFYHGSLRATLHHRYTIAIVLLLAILGLSALWIPHFIIGDLCLAIFFAWLTGRSVFGFGGLIGFILGNRVLRYIGTISYCIYLIHSYVPHMVAWTGIQMGYGQRFFVLFAVTIAMASISWYSFESQILKLKNRFE